MHAFWQFLKLAVSKSELFETNNTVNFRYYFIIINDIYYCNKI